MKSILWLDPRGDTQVHLLSDKEVQMGLNVLHPKKSIVPERNLKSTLINPSRPSTRQHLTYPYILLVAIHAFVVVLIGKSCSNIKRVHL